MKAGKFLLVYPAANSGGLLFVAVAIWYAASSQNSPAIYLLLFGLLSVFLVSIPHTLLNVAGVTIAMESTKPAFAGQEVSLPMEILNSSRMARYGIELVLPNSGAERQRIDCVPPGQAARVTLRFPARQRGQHEIGTLRLTSVYPLGFVRATKKFFCFQTYLVYPKPEGDPQLPQDRTRAAHSRSQAESGEGDDFIGVRTYVPGEPQRHVDWKAVARGQPLLTKQFAADAEGAVRLDFYTLRFADVEKRLSQLALWIVEAERASRCYSLHLPGTEIGPSLGQAHFHRCLRALGLFEAGTSRDARPAQRAKR